MLRTMGEHAYTWSNKADRSITDLALLSYSIHRAICRVYSRQPGLPTRKVGPSAHRTPSPFFPHASGSGVLGSLFLTLFDS